MGDARSGAAPGPPLRLRLALFLLSGAALAYEILLTRLFSIVQWHHFAYMMISVALLGYGASGTAVALAWPRLEHRLNGWFAGCAAVFGLLAPACFLAAQAVPFNALELFWNPRQAPLLLAVYGLLFLPFFAAALGVCALFTRFAVQARRIYAFDILGAAAGCLLVVLALYAVHPLVALAGVGAAGLFAAAMAWPQSARWSAACSLGCVLFAAGLVAWIAGSGLQLKPSPYKELSQALTVMGARVLTETSSPIGLVTVIQSDSVPFRHAPGLSLNAPSEPPPQVGVFTDAEGMSALTRFDGRLEPLAYLSYMTSALPYHLLDRPRVLVLGAGAGSDVLQALYHRAASVDAVELNPQIAALVQARFADFSGRPYSQPTVTLHLAEARGFVTASQRQYDLIQLALLDAFAASSAGLFALSETYLYTVEALQAYLQRLAPNGYLSITRWVNLPPRETLKLFATAVAALERAGVTDPARRMAMIRGWKTATLLVKNGEFTATDLARLRAFCASRSFDVAWHMGMRADEANRYNQLDRPYFYDGAVALLSPERDEFFARYKFDIRPATDDRPFFFSSFRWRTLPEVWRLRAQGGLPLIDWGYPLLVATLLQALVLSALLILAPLWVMRRRALAPPAVRPWFRTTLYFGAVGVAFMFIEIAFIQKLILFLSHPIYAVCVALFSFLLSAGLGAGLSHRFVRLRGTGQAILPCAAIAVLCASYVIVLPALSAVLIGLPDWARIAAAVAIIFPLGLAMGMPFPLGLEALSAQAPPLVPWAWGVNACLSVVSACLATLLAIHLGFNLVILIAAGLYGLAALSFPAAATAART